MTKLESFDSAGTSFWSPSPQHSHIEKTQQNGQRRENATLDAMKRRLLRQTEGEDEPFCVMDLGHVYQRYQEWRRRLPGVKVYYGMCFLPCWVA